MQRPVPRPWRRFAQLALPALLALGVATDAAAQWRWRDAAGQLHASDLPPPHDTPDASILERPKVTRPAAAASAASGVATAASAPAKSKLEMEVDARRAKAEQDQKAEAARRAASQAGIAAERADNCERAKQNLAALADGQRLARINAKGEREVMDDRIRAEEMQRVRGIIVSNCK